MLVEPDPNQYKKLSVNRPKANLSNKLIYKENKTLYFKLNGELSRINLNNNETRNNLKLNSITLRELLDLNKCPKIIDFFSLDVEGSEEDVLIDEVLDKYTFLSIVIERVSLKLHNLLQKKGYIFIMQNIYDYFYINKIIPNHHRIVLNKKKFIKI